MRVFLRVIPMCLNGFSEKFTTFDFMNNANKCSFVSSGVHFEFSVPFVCLDCAGHRC